jgi:flagellar hook-associated protein 1 FlgK
VQHLLEVAGSGLRRRGGSGPGFGRGLRRAIIAGRLGIGVDRTRGWGRREVGACDRRELGIGAGFTNSISDVNILIKQIHTLNIAIKNAVAGGNEDTGLADQRDVALTALADKIDIRISTQPDGSLQVSTNDGTNLVSQTYAQLSYDGGVRNGTFGNIRIQDYNPATGQSIGASAALDPHLSGGALKGTGMSITALLGIGDNNLANQATGFAVTQAVQTSRSGHRRPAPTSCRCRW